MDSRYIKTHSQVCARYEGSYIGRHGLWRFMDYEIISVSGLCCVGVEGVCGLTSGKIKAMKSVQGGLLQTNSLVILALNQSWQVCGYLKGSD